MAAFDKKKPKVGLFVTCLVNLFRPNIGFATIRLLQDAGCVVDVPDAQSCCGQPGYNNGDYDSARSIAKQVIETFEPFDYVVGPSGSCIATIKNDYPKLLADDPNWSSRASDVAGRSFELFSFLTDVLRIKKINVRYPGVATYHDSCSGLRGLGVKRQPRALLNGVRELTLNESPDTEVCCGFGGTFCVKYPELSRRMVDDKIEAIKSSRADTVLGGDLGCLLNIAGRLQRRTVPIRVFHTAEVLAGMADGPAIGEAER